jgi:hypothetical protein
MCPPLFRKGIIRGVMAKKLADYVGDTILIRSLPVNEDHPVMVKLIAVEDGGIWIESQDVTEHWMRELKITSFPRTPVWFLPYAQIAWILGAEDYPSMSEKALGL